MLTAEEKKELAQLVADTFPMTTWTQPALQGFVDVGVHYNLAECKQAVRDMKKACKWNTPSVPDFRACLSKFQPRREGPRRYVGVTDVLRRQRPAWASLNDQQVWSAYWGEQAREFKAAYGCLSDSAVSHMAMLATGNFVTTGMSFEQARAYAERVIRSGAG